MANSIALAEKFQPILDEICLNTLAGIYGFGQIEHILSQIMVEAS